MKLNNAYVIITDLTREESMRTTGFDVEEPIVVVPKQQFTKFIRVLADFYNVSVGDSIKVDDREWLYIDTSLVDLSLVCSILEYYSDRTIILYDKNGFSIREELRGEFCRYS